MINEHCWIPNLEYFENDKYSWNEYQDLLHNIFKQDFIESTPRFNQKEVRTRWHPIEHGKQEAFFHITCQDYLHNGQRVPDFRRCERIRWVRAFIENYNCDSSLCSNCDGVKVWREPYKNAQRVHLLLEEERYLVVLEIREQYCLLITAFYLEHAHALRKKLQKYEHHKTHKP